MLAVPGQHFIQRYLKQLGILPGFSDGITNVSRDESRHVAFGVKFLGELINSSRECRQASIEIWDRVLPWAVGVFVPPNLDHSYAECFDFTLAEIYAFGLRAFETKVQRIGFEPTEITFMTRDNRDLPYEDRARRIWVLIESGVLGDDRKEPHLSHEALDILFEGTASALDLDRARALGGPIEWEFTDADPWHIVVTDGHAEAKSGRAGNPALQLRSSSGEWAKIAVGRADPRRSLLTRRLKVHGSLAAKAKLPRLFN
jgi:hypothetical protein